MDTKDLALLEFPHIREIIGGYCSFSLSRDRALSLLPSCDFEEVKSGLEDSAEARKLLEDEPSVSISAIEDITSAVKAAERGKILDTGTLNAVRVTLEVTRLLHDKIIQHADHLPRLAAVASCMLPHLSLERAISNAISPDGELLPNASAKLASIRHKQRSCRAELVDKLQSYISSDAGRRYVQEPIVTEREGRFVIAVKSEFRNEVKGIVHDVSNSGASLFVEPWQTLDLGNAVKELQIEEAREIERILTELSEAVGAAAANICEGTRAAAEIDFSIAKARFARHFRATEAQIYRLSVSEPPFVHLEAARHPLLGEAAVPIDIDIGKEYAILVITGPNTGGKTVCLKTIGLLCTMTQAGLPIPASAKSRVPVFDGIYADIGDEQSIAQTLSTFGWHMSNISRILASAEGYSLVVLDELGASTDPQEGSALARALLIYLKENRFLAAVTTHYTELKVFAHVTDGLENASFDFDPRTLTPTYHMTLGVPGGSNAIATASHFGIPEAVISLARASLSQENQELEPLLLSLQEEKQQLESFNKELGREKETFQKQNEALSAQLKKLRDERQAMIRSSRDEIVAEIAVLQKEINTASSDLKRETSKAALSSARETSHRVRERINQGIFNKTDEVMSNETDSIAVGDRVWLRDYDVKGKVTAINTESDQIEVTAGALRFRVRLDEVAKTQTGPILEPVREVRLHASAKEVPPELDLRGKRAEEVEPLLDSYLSDAAVAKRPWVRIIHGFGTGAVRSIVRDIASRHPLAKSYKGAEQNEGGDGATIITLR